MITTKELILIIAAFALCGFFAYVMFVEANGVPVRVIVPLDYQIAISSTDIQLSTNAQNLYITASGHVYLNGKLIK